MSEARKCVQCNMVAPETNTHFTLITAGYNWRLTRRVDASGKFVIEWRCPTCAAQTSAARV